MCACVGRCRSALEGIASVGWKQWILAGELLLSHRAEGDIGVLAAASIRKRGSEISVGILRVVHGKRKIGVEVELGICTAHKAGDSPPSP